jgi:hypothetical protein
MTAPSAAQLRKFGQVVGGIFLVLAGWSFWRGHSVPPLFFGTAGGLLVVLGTIAPALLAPVERAWMRLAHVLGRINTAVILTLVYYLLFAPIGFVRRKFSDPLDRRLGEAKASHWVRRAPHARDPNRYRHQF